ncbi:hypothetical protein RAA17_21280 [Komagataeibacter rhaeticus]|nr:hypothetical protein [Komagataeibacter rhaeticus]
MVATIRAAIMGRKATMVREDMALTEWAIMVLMFAMNICFSSGVELMNGKEHQNRNTGNGNRMVFPDHTWIITYLL